MPDRLQVVAAALLIADVRVDRGVPRRPRQILALAEGDVLVVRVLVALCEAEVDDVNVVLSALRASDQEVVRLDVAVDDSLLVDFLDALDLQRVRAGHLPSAQQCGARS